MNTTTPTPSQLSTNHSTLHSSLSTLSEALHSSLSVKQLAKYLFPDFCSLPFNSMHDYAFNLHNKNLLAARQYATDHNLPKDHPDIIAKRQGTRSLIIAPRGSAKSTICTLMLPLIDICLRQEAYIVIISATRKQAIARLRAIATQIKHNTQLRELISTKGKINITQDKATELEFNNIRIEAYGAGCEIRGISNGRWRPTHIILDDIEPTDKITKPAFQNQIKNWYNSVIEPLGATYTNITVVGTLIHPRSLLAIIAHRPDYKKIIFSSIIQWSHNTQLWEQWKQILMSEQPDAIEKAHKFYTDNKTQMTQDTKVLWPENETYEQLMIMREINGHKAFDAEKQNTPSVATTQGEPIMTIDKWQKLTYQPQNQTITITQTNTDTDDPNQTTQTINIPLKKLTVNVAIDPSGGRTPDADDAAIIVGAYDHEIPNSPYYILDGTLVRTKYSEQAKIALQYAIQYGATTIGHEQTGQFSLNETLETQWKTITQNIPYNQQPTKPKFTPLTHNIGKTQRATKFAAILASNHIAYNRDIIPEILLQCEAFPNPTIKDDAPDAIINLLELRQKTNTNPTYSKKLTQYYPI